jgi:hypothetical protein
LRAGLDFCSNCGIRYDGVSTTSTGTATPSQRNRAVLISVAGVGALAFLALGAAAILPGGSDDEPGPVETVYVERAAEPETADPAEPETADPANSPPDSAAPKPTTVTASAAESVISRMYVAWSSHDDATVRSLVADVPGSNGAPLYAAWSPTFLKPGYSVTNTNTSATPNGDGSVTVCGTQTFRNDVGKTQDEYRCSTVSPINGQALVTATSLKQTEGTYN